MRGSRASQGTALLENGEVLVAGRVAPWWPGSSGGSPTATAELYNPTAGIWRSTASMISPAVSQATRLENGRVLVAGDNGENAEIYDPSTGKWKLTSSMYFPGQYATTAVLLTSVTC